MRFDFQSDQNRRKGKGQIPLWFQRPCMCICLWFENRKACTCYRQIHNNKIKTLVHSIMCLHKNLYVSNQFNPIILLLITRTTETKWSFFSTKSQTFGLGQTIWTDNFWGIWGIVGWFISTQSRIWDWDLTLGRKEFNRPVSVVRDSFKYIQYWIFI